MSSRGRGSSKRGRGRGRGRPKARSQNLARPRRALPRQIKLKRPKSFEELFRHFRMEPNMDSRNINKLLGWYIELYFSPKHLPLFESLPDFPVKNTMFVDMLERMKLALENPVKMLSKTMNVSHMHGSKFDENIYSHVICDLQGDELQEAFDLLDDRLKRSVKVLYWKKRKKEGDTWRMDQSDLPEGLRNPKVKRTFEEHVKALVDTRNAKALGCLMKEFQKDDFERIQWPHGYCALRYAARAGGLEVAKAFLEIQRAPVPPYRGKSFHDFLNEHQRRFIPIYNEWLEALKQNEKELRKILGDMELKESDIIGWIAED